MLLFGERGQELLHFLPFGTQAHHAHRCISGALHGLVIADDQLFFRKAFENATVLLKACQLQNPLLAHIGLPLLQQLQHCLLLRWKSLQIQSPDFRSDPILHFVPKIDSGG